MLGIGQATHDRDFDVVRGLLREYQTSLDVDLCFQNFEAELRELPGAYAPPRGRLLIATYNGEPVGCVALRSVDASRCEMKRLYVRPHARGLGIGKRLVSQILDEARIIGYEEILLDTLPAMTEAQRMYERFGFVDIAAYRPNPIPGTRYLARFLNATLPGKLSNM